jgi:hypothetical protein
MTDQNNNTGDGLPSDLELVLANEPSSLNEAFEDLLHAQVIEAQLMTTATPLPANHNDPIAPKEYFVELLSLHLSQPINFSN